MGQRCQSCGMPLNRDPNGGGIEADGTKSHAYCSICYENGAFVHQDITARDFQAQCVTAMSDNGMPRPMAWLLTRGIPKLKRWTS